MKSLLFCCLILAACSAPREASIRPPVVIPPPVRVHLSDTMQLVKRQLLVTDNKLIVLPLEQPKILPVSKPKPVVKPPIKPKPRKK